MKKLSFKVAALFYLVNFGFGYDYVVESELQYGSFSKTSANIRILSGVTDTPVVFVEGFDILNEDDLTDIYEDYVQPLEYQLPNHTIYILDWDNSQAHMQANAMTLLAVLESIHGNTDIPIKIIGSSMGGVIARFALAYAEQNEIEHNVDLYISLDSPQKGANVPMGLQAALQDLRNKEDGAKEFSDAIKSAAAKQLLVHNYYDQDHSEHNDFYNAIKNLGYPQKCRNIAVSSGSRTGQTQGIGVRTKAVEVYGYYFVPPFPYWEEIIIRIYASGEPGISQKLYYRKFEKWIVGGTSTDKDEKYYNQEAAWDDAPGSYFNGFEKFFEKVPEFNYWLAGAEKSLYEESHCFIPTISSLDINGYDIFNNNDVFADVSGINDLAGTTPFNAIYIENDNVSHSDPSTGAIAFIVNEIQTVKPKFSIVPTILTPLLLN